MSTLDSVKMKVQRILTDGLGKVEVDRDGDYIVRYESAVTFVSVYLQQEDDPDSDVVIRCYSLMVVEVPVTPAVFKWVATEGQDFAFGGSYMVMRDDEKECFIGFRYTIVGNDLDPHELVSAVIRVTTTANRLDDELKAKFGGRLFSES